MTSLTSLIERIEAATEGSRELDGDIWLASTPGATRDKWSYIHKATGRECTVDETRDETGRLIIVPEYSTSFDAALTLLPDNSIADVATTGVAWVDVTGDPCLHTAKCATAPLALLAAILRARQAMQMEASS